MCIGSIIETQMEKTMEHEIDSSPYSGFAGRIGPYWA